MPDIIQETPAAEPLPTSPQTEPQADDAPLSDHVDAFHSDKQTETEPEPDQAAAPAEPKKKHKSFNAKARREDAPRIQALVGERNEWKAKYEALAKGPASAAVPPSVDPRSASVPVPAVTGPTAFSVPEPTLDQFQDKDDPYGSWVRAVAKWDRQKEAFDGHVAAQRFDAEQQQTRAIDEARQGVQQRMQGYQGKLDAYLKSHPDRVPAFQNIPNVSPLMLESIWAADNGPELVYSLRQQPALFAELLLLTEGKPVSQDYVASVTSWLQSRLQAGTTGAAVGASPRVTPAPRPPTPVRTPPNLPVADPPGDSGSLLDHQSFYKTVKR